MHKSHVLALGLFRPIVNELAVLGAVFDPKVKHTLQMSVVSAHPVTLCLQTRYSQ